MMTLGSILQIVEVIVTVYCGSILAVQPNKMRWEGKAPKLLFYVLLLLAMVFSIGNISYSKSVETVYYIVALYLFIVLKIFYKIDFWKLCLQNFIYWWSIILTHNLAIYIVCLDMHTVVMDYINSTEPMWHWLHMLTMGVTIAAVIFLVYIKKGKDLLICQQRRGYIIASIVVISEPLIESIVLPKKTYTSVMVTETVVFAFLYICLLFLLVIVFIGMQSYTGIKHNELVSKYNFELLKQQYASINQIYTENRKQVHDYIYRNILLLGYLEDGNINKALDVLKEALELERKKSKHKYTGITAIDFILDFKIGAASKYDIKILCDTDVLYCPVCDYEICIILGNLLDNAIEAVMDLESELRKIYISMKTRNNVFLLEMRNPYCGKRKKRDGKYITTKSDKNLHGLGIGNVMTIVNNYDGSFEITDNNGTFEVSIGILKNKDKSA